MEIQKHQSGELNTIRTNHFFLFNWITKYWDLYGLNMKNVKISLSVHIAHPVYRLTLTSDSSGQVYFAKSLQKI